MNFLYSRSVQDYGLSMIIHEQQHLVSFPGNSVYCGKPSELYFNFCFVSGFFMTEIKYLSSFLVY